jgi:tetratricopeptide (TPR) repeat protein
MLHFRPSVILGLLAALLLWGCQLPGRQGAVSRSLATCRQLSQQGIAALERGHQEEAETLLASAVDACPVDPEARRHYAEALWGGGEAEEAIAQLEEACRLAGDDATLRVRLAEMHLHGGQLVEARQTAEQALDLDPKLPGAWAIQGRVMGATGQPEEALANFHRALSFAPQDQQILLEIANLYCHLNWPQRALATLQSLAEGCSPGDEPQEVLWLTGRAYTALGRYEEAVESLSAAAERGEPTPELLCQLAEAQLSCGRPAEAEAAARRALAMQPQNAASRQLLDRLLLARRSQEPIRR